MELESILLNYYQADIKKSTPLGIVSLYRMLQAIQYPRAEIIEVFNSIKEAEVNGDMALKAELKTKLFSFTPCVLVNGRRRYADIVKFTGLLVLDFDHIENAEEFRNELFFEYRCIVACWLSASRHGVRVIIRIPEVKSPDEFKQYFEGVAVEFSKYLGFDRAPQNCILPMFLSYDPDILVRTNYTVWTKKVVKMVAPPVQQYVHVSGNKHNNIEAIIESAVSKIQDAGHPILRSTAFALGGYVGANYLSSAEAENMINRIIDRHSYLNKKPAVYKATAKTMISRGSLNPLYLT